VTFNDRQGYAVANMKVRRCRRWSLWNGETSTFSQVKTVQREWVEFNAPPNTI